MPEYFVPLSVGELFSSDFSLRGADVAQRGISIDNIEHVFTKHAVNNLLKEIKVSVRAKFFCVEATKRIHGSTVILQPVARGEENKLWAAATPSGRLEMTILNDVAAEVFEPGNEYYLDITPVPKDA